MLNFQPLYKQYLTKESNFFDGVKDVENPAQFDLLKNIKVKSMDEMLKLLKSEGATPAQINKFREVRRKYKFNEVLTSLQSQRVGI